MRSALANPGSAVAAQGFLSVPGILQSQELTSLEQQGVGGVFLVEIFGDVFFGGWKKCRCLNEMKHNYNWCPGIIFYFKGCSYLRGIMKNLDKQVTSGAGAVVAMA